VSSVSWWSKALFLYSLLMSSFSAAFASLSLAVQGLYERSVPLPSSDSAHCINHLPSGSRILIDILVLCWFEDLDKGNVLHIKPYYLSELIITFHAGLRISIDIYSNQNHAYRWQLVTIPSMCTLQLSTTTFPRPRPSSILDEMTFTCFLQTICLPDSLSSINLNGPDM
jgi:hypothetical protein